MAPGVEGPPEKRRTFQENGPWHGRSPGKTQDLPGKWPLAWKVPRKNAGPSGKMASGVEGPPEKGRTFRENGPWHGRSPGKTQDLPGKWLLAWKVPRKKAGPSRKTGSGMEGPPEKRRTFRENGSWHGRSPGKTQDLPGKRALAWKVPLKNAGPSRKMAPGMEGPPEKRRTFRENGPWHGRSWGRCRASPEKGWFFGTELLIGRGNPRKVPFSWMGLESSAGGAA